MQQGCWRWNGIILMELEEAGLQKNCTACYGYDLWFKPSKYNSLVNAEVELDDLFYPV